jgi:hypothetical protein
MLLTEHLGCLIEVLKARLGDRSREDADEPAVPARPPASARASNAKL